MKVSSKEIKENKNVSFVVELGKDEFEAAVNKAYVKNRKSISVPGFRKGKAPRAIIENMYGTEVFYEDAVDELSGEAFGFGVETEGLKPVGRPAITNYEVQEDKSLLVTFETAVYPEITLGQYKGIEAPKAECAVTDEELSQELERIQKRNSRIVTQDRPAKDSDSTLIDFEGFMDGVPFEGGKGEGHELVLGSGQFVPGFEEQLIGMSAGEEKDIDITFPQEYHPELAGKAVVFHVKLHEVREIQLPELDDEFAKDVSEFDTFVEYKENVRSEMLASKEKAADEDFRNKLVAKAIENMSVELPDAMVEEQIDSMVREYAHNLSRQGYELDDYLGRMGVDMKFFRESARASAVRQLKNDMLLAKIADAEGFVIDEETVEAEYAKIAESTKYDLETVKKIIARQTLEDDLSIKKAAELIYTTGVATAPEETPEPEASEDPQAE